MFNSFMFWNCQGVTLKEFLQTFRTLVFTYKLCLIAWFEQKISGCKADWFIVRSGFYKSHLVEAIGFSWEIWLLRNNNFIIEIDLNHKQFIYVKIKEAGGSFS